MEPNEEESELKSSRSEAAQEEAEAPVAFAGLGSVLLVIALVALIIAVRKPQQQSPRLTAEELEQLKYDSEQQKREKQKADQIRDQAFLLRKGDDNQAQLDRLLKDLNMDESSAAGLPTPIPDHQARAEEAIAHILRLGTEQAGLHPNSREENATRSAADCDRFKVQIRCCLLPVLVEQNTWTRRRAGCVCRSCRRFPGKKAKAQRNSGKQTRGTAGRENVWFATTSCHCMRERCWKGCL
jgi:hypothetical protein